MDTTAQQLTVTEIYEINFIDGATGYFTSHDKNISYGGNVYQAIPIKRSPIRYHTNLQVDKVDISLGITGVKVGTREFSIPEVVRRDYIRNAHVKIHLIDYVALNETQMLFEGWVTGNITFNGGVLTASVGSILDKLKDKFPKFIYSEFCQHQLYDSYCGLTKSSYKTSGTVGFGGTNQVIYSSDFAVSESGYFEKGEIHMTSGSNSGVIRSIITHDTAEQYVKTLLPFPDDISESGTFDVYPGCDRSGETCWEKFSNGAQFFGFEFIPKPDILMP